LIEQWEASATKKYLKMSSKESMAKINAIISLDKPTIFLVSLLPISFFSLRYYFNHCRNSKGEQDIFYNAPKFMFPQKEENVITY
jgi:hypothetical protein